MVAVTQQQTKRKTIRQSWRGRDALQGKTVQTASVMLYIYTVCRVAKLAKRRSIAEVGGSSPPTATNIQARMHILNHIDTLLISSLASRDDWQGFLIQH